MLDGWQQLQTSTGIPYYVNHCQKKSQWDHPFVASVLEELSDYDSICYAAYRTASKLRHIQKRLRIELLDVATITEMFDRHGYSNKNDSSISCSQLYSVLYDMYMHTRCNKTQHISCETLAEITHNYLLSLYDIHRTGIINVLSVKTGLVILSRGKLTDKYNYIFSCYCDAGLSMDKVSVTNLLVALIQLPDHINESVAFGGLDVSAAVSSCMSDAASSNIICDTFLQWLSKEPQTVVWISALHRLKCAEDIRHDVICTFCKVTPIVGFRYKCLHCLQHNLCQDCFFHNRINKKHQIFHPIQEYCTKSTIKEHTQAFMKTIMNRFSKKYRYKRRLAYLPIEAIQHNGEGTSDYLDSFDSTTCIVTEHSIQHHNSEKEIKIAQLLDLFEKKNKAVLSGLENQGDNTELLKNSRQLAQYLIQLRRLVQMSKLNATSLCSLNTTSLCSLNAIIEQSPIKCNNVGQDTFVEETSFIEGNTTIQENKTVLEESTPSSEDSGCQSTSLTDDSVCMLVDNLSTAEMSMAILDEPDATDNYGSEKMQIQKLIEMLQCTTDSSDSFVVSPDYQNNTMHEMMNAANKIGEAMTDFVSNKHPVSNNTSLFQLAECLGVTEDSTSF